ncbi:MAG: hypothetical protein AAF682_11650 [Planctomycetota bacterium]
MHARSLLVGGVMLTTLITSACQGGPGLRRSTDLSTGETVWRLDWGDDGGSELLDEVAYASAETADPLAGDVQLKQVTSLGPKTHLLSFDVDPQRSQILMSVLDGIEGRSQKPFANVWLASVDSADGRKTRITEGQHLDLTPTFASGGAILFASNRVGQTLSIFRQQLTGGGGVQLITGQSSQDIWPQVDPATGQLLFTQVRSASTGNGILWVRPMEGGAPTQVGEGSGARWSPDGKLLLYSSVDSASGNSHLWIRPIAGGQQMQITHGDHNDVNPSWSPDGSMIVFASDRARTADGQPNYDIWLMEVQGGAPRRLTANESLDDTPRWLDSETVLFRSNRGREWNIWSLKVSQAGE